MENISAYAVRRIKEEIPREILQDTFVRRGIDNELYTHVSLDAAIIAAVLVSGVYLDIKLLTGRETIIDLTGIEPHYNSDGSATIAIPLSRTGGKDILEVFRVGFGNTYSSAGLTYTNAGMSEVDAKLNAIIDSTNSIPITSTSECTIIAPNVVHVELYSQVLPVLSAEVNLAVGNDMGHIPPVAFDAFGELCVERCKQYISTLNRISLDRGRIERGTEIGAFAEEILEYRDSGKNYRDLLKVWRRSEVYMNPEKIRKFIGWMVPSLM